MGFNLLVWEKPIPDRWVARVDFGDRHALESVRFTVLDMRMTGEIILRIERHVGPGQWDPFMANPIWPTFPSVEDAKKMAEAWVVFTLSIIGMQIEFMEAANDMWGALAQWVNTTMVDHLERIWDDMQDGVNAFVEAIEGSDEYQAHLAATDEKTQMAPMDWWLNAMKNHGPPGVDGSKLYGLN